MSDITSEKAAQSLWVDIDDSKGNISLKEAEKLLVGIRGGLAKAFGAAAVRTAKSSANLASKDVRKLYIIGDSDFKRHTYTEFHTHKGEYGVAIDFRGYHIPLISFDTKISKSGKIVTRVKRTSVATELNHAFAQSVGTGRHFGVFERAGEDRLPIRELLGPSVPQMMSSNSDLQEAIAEHTKETFEKRFDHEVTRILNGWGR